MEPKRFGTSRYKLGTKLVRVELAWIDKLAEKRRLGRRQFK
jgi:hypothetical protein